MIGFVYELREAGIPVSVQYILEFYGALTKGLASTLDQLFLLARLVFVKRVEHYDLFEQVFCSFFLGRDAARKAPDWEDLLAGKPFADWLRHQMDQGLLSPEEIRKFNTEELLARFWETLLAQDGEHHGGATWVGTRGRSPFGHSGQQAGGIRVHGAGLYHSAQKVISERRYIDYSERASLSANNLRQVLTTMRSLRPIGPEAELDVDATIARTARNGGEIELVFSRERRNRVRLIVLLDNGGMSMTPFIPLVKTVFDKIRDGFQNVRFHYFHNCIYGAVYADPPRTQPVSWERLMAEPPHTRLLIIGDANMAPFELMASYGSLGLATTERRPGIEWLKELRGHFRAAVWLNPLVKERWREESATILRIGNIFHMEDLTLGGIKNAVEFLNVQGKELDRV